MESRTVVQAGATACAKALGQDGACHVEGAVRRLIWLEQSDEGERGRTCQAA